MPEKITRLPGAKASRGRSTSYVAIEDALDEALSPLRAFQRIMDDEYATGDVAIVLEALTANAYSTARDRLEERLSDGAK